MKLNETKIWQGEFNSIAYNATQFKTLCGKYTDEMNIFIQRVKDHPSMQQIGVKSSSMVDGNMDFYGYDG